MNLDNEITKLKMLEAIFKVKIKESKIIVKYRNMNLEGS